MEVAGKRKIINACAKEILEKGDNRAAEFAQRLLDGEDLWPVLEQTIPESVLSTFFVLVKGNLEDEGHNRGMLRTVVAVRLADHQGIETEMRRGIDIERDVIEVGILKELARRATNG